MSLRYAATTAPARLVRAGNGAVRRRKTGPVRTASAPPSACPRRGALRAKHHGRPPWPAATSVYGPMLVRPAPRRLVRRRVCWASPRRTWPAAVRRRIGSRMSSSPGAVRLEGVLVEQASRVAASARRVDRNTRAGSARLRSRQPRFEEGDANASRRHRAWCTPSIRHLVQPQPSEECSSTRRQHAVLQARGVECPSSSSACAGSIAIASTSGWVSATRNRVSARFRASALGAVEQDLSMLALRRRELSGSPKRRRRRQPVQYSS